MVKKSFWLEDEQAAWVEETMENANGTESLLIRGLIEKAMKSKKPFHLT